MFIFRKIKYVILSLVAFLVIGIGAGVSYWVFANEGYNREINSDSNIDNIYENYTFGKESITDKYDIYFFPSTYYLYRYANGKDIYGNSIGTTDKPEDIYGYLELDETNSGFSIKSPVGSKNATTEIYAENYYHIDINGLNDCFSDLDYYEQYEHNWIGSDKPYSEHLGTYLSIKYGNAANYSGYTKRNNINVDYDWGYVKANVIDVNETDTSAEGGVGSFGNVTADENDGENNNVTSDYLSSEKYNIYQKYNDSEKADPYYQRLEIDDRLGYWPNLDVDEGRYLPIKLSFDSYINYEIITKLILGPKTDMGDNNNWFTSKFSGWISVRNEDISNYVDYLPVDGFKYKDQNNLVDFMSNLKDYADYNSETGRYVIRLFPTFSNGKNYDEALGTGSPDQINGFRDGIRLDYFNETSDSKLSMETRFFSFKGGTTDSYNYTNESNESIDLTLNYASINNFSFDEDTKAIELRCTKIGDKGSDKGWIQVNQTNGSGNTEKSYDKDWLDFMSSDGKLLGDNFYFKINDEVTTTEIINLFSANQLYNIYIVTCLRNTNTVNNQCYYTDPSNAIKDLESALYNPDTDLLKSGTGNVADPNLSDSEKENIFPVRDLQGKQLYNLGTFLVGGSPKNYTLNRTPKQAYAAYTILYEEVADLRLVQDISIIESASDDENGDPVYTEDETNTINQQVANKVADSRGLAMNTDNIYKGTISTNSDNENEINNIANISSNNPYIYRIDGVDFRFSDTLSFVIAVNGKINNEINFKMEPLNDANSEKLISSSEEVSNGDILPEDEEIFTNASNFVNLCKTTGKDGTEYNVFKLKPINDKDNAKGYYSFIFEFDSAIQGFNVYCYRFKNIFVKVFDKKPDIYTEPSEDNYEFLNHSTGEYFTCEYYAGNSIDTKNDLYVPTNSTDVTNSQNLEDVFRYFVGKRLASNSEGDLYKDPGNNGNSAYYLIDSVSERVLGVAKCTGDTISSVTFAEDLSLSKNYVFYVVSETYYENNMLLKSSNT